MSNHKKNIVTEKHIETITDQNIKLVFTIFGNFQANITGKITGRVRNRFKQFIFIPTFPFMSFAFSVGDVEKIELIDEGIVVNLFKVEEKKKRRKKKKVPSVVAIEPDLEIDLSSVDVFETHKLDI